MVSLDECKAGDTVEITVEKNGKKTYSGMILPRPELFDPNILVLKLENGYNIGIEKKSISAIKKISELAVKQKEKKEISPKSDLPTVSLLSFGGTISSRVDYRTGGVVADYDASDFFTMMPELADIANIKAKKIAQLMTEDMDATHWGQIAQSVASELNIPSTKGVVITVGTDMLHYIASAISFMLGDLNKPVIITASQRSIDRGSSDAFENLICAVRAAAEFDGAVVATCLHETSSDGSCLLIRGTKVRKMHTSRRDAFRPINEQALARITPQGEITRINTKYPLRKDNAIQPKIDFEKKISLIQIYPGIEPEVIQYFIDNEYKGLVISATALGHVPATILDVLEQAAKKMMVVIVSQTLYGRVHPYVYTRLREMSIKKGLEFAEDILPETAFTKLGWVLANTKNIKETKKIFLQNLQGEFAQEIDEKSYLA